MATARQRTAVRQFIERNKRSPRSRSVDWVGWRGVVSSFFCGVFNYERAFLLFKSC